MIGMFLKLFDSTEGGKEVSFIIPLDIPLEAAALILGDGLLPFLVEKYDVEHANEICSRMISGDYDYTLGNSFLTHVMKVSNSKRHGSKKPDSNVDEEKGNVDVLKSEIMGEDWDVGGMGLEENPPAYSSTKVIDREEIETMRKGDSSLEKEGNSYVLEMSSDQVSKGLNSKEMSPSHQCEICSSSLKTKRGLQKHIIKVHGEKTRFCSFCSKAFRDQYDLNRHLRHAHKMEPVKTEIAQNTNFKSFSKMETMRKEDSSTVVLKMSPDQVSKALIPKASVSPCCECQICSASFKSMLTLKRHIRKCHGEKTHICSFCSKSFTNKYDVSRHMRNVHEETSEHYKCEICSSVLKSRESFLVHQRRVHSERNLKCSLCKKAFKNRYAVKCHLRNIHKIETVKKGENSKEKKNITYILEESPNQNSKAVISKETEELEDWDVDDLDEEDHSSRIGSTDVLLKEEEKDEEDEEDEDEEEEEAMSPSYQCEICSSFLKTKRGLKKHIIKVHGEKSRFCSFCSKGFSDQYDLNRHLWHFHKIESAKTVGKSQNLKIISKIETIRKEEKPADNTNILEGSPNQNSKAVISKEHKKPSSYTCDINCGQVFASKVLFQRHQRSTHREFFCTLCVKAFLTSHTCHRPHKCEVCGRGFNNRNVLKKHLLIHTGEKPHVCESCGKAFTQSSVLQKHQIIHKTRQILACDQCDATFIDEYAFENHKVLHTGEVSHVCEVCNKTFVSKASLREHRKLHSKITFECEVCKKTFHHRHKLNVHMTVHSGVRSHVCETCPSAFFFRNELLKHRQRAHGENGSVCSLCKTAFPSRIHLKRHMLSHET